MLANFSGGSGGRDSGGTGMDCRMGGRTPERSKTEGRGGMGGAQRDERSGRPQNREVERGRKGGGMPPDESPTQTTPGMVHGNGDRIAMVAATLPQCP